MTVKLPNTWDGIIELQLKSESRSDIRQIHKTIVPDIHEPETRYREQSSPSELVGFAIQNCPFPLEHIERLAIRNLPITELPQNTSKLINLKEASFNRTELRRFPDVLLELTELHRITFHDSKINGVPEKIAKLKRLKILILTKQEIEEFPNEVIGIDGLEYLGLAMNQLNSVPSSISQMEKLKRLDLYKNNLSTIPSSLELLSELEVMWLHGNNFTEEENLIAKNLLPKIELILGKPVDKKIDNTE